MMEHLKGKKVSVAVAFIGGKSNFAGTPLGGTEYYEGTVVDLNDNFLIFNDGSMIGVKYIQIIKIIG